MMNEQNYQEATLEMSLMVDRFMKEMKIDKVETINRVTLRNLFDKVIVNGTDVPELDKPIVSRIGDLALKDAPEVINSEDIMKYFDLRKLEEIFDQVFGNQNGKEEGDKKDDL